MTDRPDPLTFTRFIDWCRAKYRLTAEAKRTVEGLLYQLKPYMGKICRLSSLATMEKMAIGE
jgi:hypothetical protein